MTNKLEPMTKQEFAKRMRIIACRDDDPERAHCEADELLCKTLRSLGYGVGVDVFVDIKKWYA